MAKFVQLEFVRWPGPGGREQVEVNGIRTCRMVNPDHVVAVWKYDSFTTYLLLSNSPEWHVVLGNHTEVVRWLEMAS